MNWLLATIVGLSLSVRTPNDDTKPLDYEIAVKSVSYTHLTLPTK